MWESRPYFSSFRGGASLRRGNPNLKSVEIATALTGFAMTISMVEIGHVRLFSQ